MRARKMILSTIVGGVVLVTFFLGIKIRNALISNKEGLAEILPTTFSLPDDYKLLLNDTYKNRIEILKVRNSKVRPPVAQLLIEDKYLMYIFKVDSTNRFKVGNSILIESGSAKRTTGISYRIFDEDFYYQLQFKSGLIPQGSVVYLKLNGDSVQTIKENDSTFICSLICKNLSLRHGRDEPIAVFVEGNLKNLHTIKVPMSLMIIKRNGRTFIIILTTKEPEDRIPPNFISSVIN